MRILIIGIKWPPATFIDNLIDGFASSDIQVTIALENKPDKQWLSMPNRRWVWTPNWEVTYAKRFINSIKLLFHNLFHLFEIPFYLPNGDFVSMIKYWYRVSPFIGKDWDAVYFPWILASNKILRTYFKKCNIPIIVSCRGAATDIEPYGLNGRRVKQELAEIFEQSIYIHCVSYAMLNNAISLGLKV